MNNHNFTKNMVFLYFTIFGGMIVYKKRFAPALYYKATTNRYNQLAGAAAQTSPKEKRGKEREINADTGSSTKRRWTISAAPSREVPPHA